MSSALPPASPVSSASALLPASDDAGVQEWNLNEVVQALRHSREHAHNVRHKGRIRELPSRDALVQIVQGLSAALFPTHLGRPDLSDASIDYYVGNTLNSTLVLLAEQVRRGLLFNTDADPLADAGLPERASHITRTFAAELPNIRALLVSDLQAAYQGDPAATSVSEILLCYPGMTAIIHYRLAHALYRLGTPLLARLISDIAHSRTGIDIHPGAEIGGAFFIDHGTGVVIGQTTVIGQGVRLYQAVTLGAKRFPTDDEGHLVKGHARHPIVEDDVVIYAGATVLGRITVGKGSTIGGNVWLTHSVPPGSNVTQALSRQT
jgi:serine O-acetyltransferase